MAKVLIVEDNFMIADMLEAVLTAHGYEVCGIACNVAEAVALGLRHEPDFALIDVRLADDELGTAIPAQLASLTKLGILYATGNSSQIGDAIGHAYITKPYCEPDILRGLEIVAEIVATGAASPPFPPGFKLMCVAADPGPASAKG